MQKNVSSLEVIKLVGIKTRTCNKDEFNSNTARIMPCVQKYFQEQLSEKILNRINPNRTFCAYTEYENDYTGKYTFFIGEEVSEIINVPEYLDNLIIPQQEYIKFTTEAGSMPNIVINSWQEIWKMSSETLGGTRRYHTDFELYDVRSKDPTNAIVDIYIGIKS